MGSLRLGCDAVAQDIDTLRKKLDPFLVQLQAMFTVVPHTPQVHYRGDLRFVQGLPPDEPKRGVQDCRIFEAALDIAQGDLGTVRPGKFFLTKDSDFLKKKGVQDELKAVDVDLVGEAAPLYGRFR